jgi:site-specific DNA recombinase
MMADKIDKIRKDVQELYKENSEQVIAAIYARVSSPKQMNNYSLDEQVRICRERCKLMGWKVRYIFRDIMTAESTDRPMFRKMMEKAKQGKFDVIVFWRLDRLCRSLIDAINVEKELREYGVALHSVTEQIDTTTPVGRFNFRNLASAAELERELIKERTRMGMYALAMQHRWPNKRPPLGYRRREDGKLEIDEEEAKLVRKIFELYIETRSMPHIAFLLNKEGIRTKDGKEWTAPTIKKILDNEIYIGRFRVAGVDDYVEEYRIIEDELFQKARKIRLRFRNGEGRRESMPEERKKGLIDRIFQEYFAYLNELEEEDEVADVRLM